MNLSCHCGQVRVNINQRPEYIHECNCSLCAKSGARWGYFHPSKVHVVGSTTGYSRADKTEPIVEVHFCGTCGSTTHFRLTANAVAKWGDLHIGVNMWLAKADDLAGIELRYPDGRAWTGQGEFGYVGKARIMGRESNFE